MFDRTSLFIYDTDVRYAINVMNRDDISNQRYDGVNTDGMLHELSLLYNMNHTSNDIIHYINTIVEEQGRNDHIYVNIIENVIYCDKQYPNNIIYVLDLIDDYCHVDRKYCTIKSNIEDSILRTMLYKWIGKNKIEISNIRLFYYIIAFLYLFMLIATCFFLLFLHLLI